MKKHIVLACVCISVLAAAAFAQTTGDIDMYYGKVVAINTGYYYGTGYCCGVQLEPVNDINVPVQHIAGPNGRWIVMVRMSNPLCKEILATLYAAQASNMDVHLRTSYRTAELPGRGFFNELLEAAIGEQWTAWTPFP